jgi:hypothetical protein
VSRERKALCAIGVAKPRLSKPSYACERGWTPPSSRADFESYSVEEAPQTNSPVRRERWTREKNRRDGSTTVARCGRSGAGTNLGLSNPLQPVPASERSARDAGERGNVIYTANREAFTGPLVAG